jgi:hypothetical protein
MLVSGSRFSSRLSWLIPLAVSAACSAGRAPGEPGPGASRVSAITIPFPGSGNSGQSQLLLAGFAPNSCGVAGPTANFDGGATVVTPPDHVTCYFNATVSATTPMAFLEQVVETAQGQGLVHVR